jgi:hypothetical protein
MTRLPQELLTPRYVGYLFLGDAAVRMESADHNLSCLLLWALAKEVPCLFGYLFSCLIPQPQVICTLISTEASWVCLSLLRPIEDLCYFINVLSDCVAQHVPYLLSYNIILHL